MNINCINNKIANSNGIRQPIILQKIKDIWLNGNHQMTARMVKNQCAISFPNITWNEKITAICNTMRNAIECGGRVIGEDRDFNDFTIAFDGNNIEIKTPKKTNLKVESKIKEKSSNNSEIVKKSKKTKPSINKIDEFRELIKKYKLEKLKDDKRPKLLIIPCSKSKSPGGVDLFNTTFNLNSKIKNSIKLYKSELRINPNYFSNENRIGQNIVDVNYFNAAFNNKSCKKAIDRYDSGRSAFYSNYNLKELYVKKINNHKLHVLIISGLYGLLKFDDFIPDYHFEMRRNAIWKNKNDFSIRNEVNMYIEKNKIPAENVFYSLADNEYRMALKPDPNWKPLWISNYSASPKNSAKFIAEEFLTRL